MRWVLVQWSAWLLMGAWALQSAARDRRNGWRATCRAQDRLRRRDWRRSLARGRLVHGLEPAVAATLSRGWLQRPRRTPWLELPGLTVLSTAAAVTPSVQRLDQPLAAALLLAVTCAGGWAVGSWADRRFRRRCERLLVALRQPVAV